MKIRFVWPFFLHIDKLTDNRDKEEEEEINFVQMENEEGTKNSQIDTRAWLRFKNERGKE